MSTPNMAFDDQQKLLATSFLKLPQPDNKVQCMHVWIDGTLRNFRSKDKTLPKKPVCVNELPLMEFCGSATDFDVGNLADYYSKPVKFYRDPFRRGENTIIYCETYSREGLPTFANNRYRLLAARKKCTNQINKFAFVQSYTLLRRDGRPLTYLEPAYTSDSKSGFICGREVADAHYRACLYSGVNIGSYEPASNQGQWTYSIGPGDSVDIADDSWISRLILVKIAEDFGVVISFESSPKYSCLVPTYAGLSIITESMVQQEKQRIVEDLLSQFVVKEGKAVKFASLQDKIRVSNINPEVDPYALLTKIKEALSQNST